MNRWIAFLRAINVGGRNVKMEELKALFKKMGFSNVETFIASGNVIFESKSSGGVTLEKKIEMHLDQALGYEVAVFVRTVKELAVIAKTEGDLIKKVPWKVEALNVGFLKGPLVREKLDILKGLETDIDALEVRGCELYWSCRKKQSESKCSNVLLERKLGVKLTFRGIKTVRKLAESLEKKTE